MVLMEPEQQVRRVTLVLWVRRVTLVTLVKEVPPVTPEKKVILVTLVIRELERAFPTTPIGSEHVVQARNHLHRRLPQHLPHDPRNVHEADSPAQKGFDGDLIGGIENRGR